MTAQAGKQSIRCSMATRVASWVSSVLAVLALVQALPSKDWMLVAAAAALAAFAAISYRKANNDFITIDDHQLSVSNHPLGDPAAHSVPWAAILEARAGLSHLHIGTAKGDFNISVREFPRGTTARLMKEIRERAPWANLKK